MLQSYWYTEHTQPGKDALGLEDVTADVNASLDLFGFWFGDKWKSFAGIITQKLSKPWS